MVFSSIVIIFFFKFNNNNFTLQIYNCLSILMIFFSNLLIIILIILIIIKIIIFIIQVIIFIITLNLSYPSLSGSSCNTRPKSIGSLLNVRPKSFGSNYNTELISLRSWRRTQEPWVLTSDPRELGPEGLEANSKCFGSGS